MSRIPPIFRGGLSWACAALALRANAAAKMPDKICLIEKTSLDRLALNGGLVIAVAAIMPHAQERSKRRRATRARLPRMFSAKRNGEMQRDGFHAVTASAAHCARNDGV